MKKVLTLILVTSVLLSSILVGVVQAGGVEEYVPSEHLCGLVAEPGEAYEESPLNTRPETALTSEKNSQNATRGDPDAGNLDWSQYTTVNKYAAVVMGNLQSSYSTKSYVYTNKLFTESNGFLQHRERVFVITSYNNGYMYIRYNSNGTAKYGYVANTYIRVPQYDYARPIKTGKVGSWFGDSYSSGPHYAIDINGWTANPSMDKSIYAMSTGYYGFKAQFTYENGSGPMKYASYGNYCGFTDINGNVFHYAHLSQLGGFTPLNIGTLGRSMNSSETLYTHVYDGKNVVKGEKIGEIGNTGNSTGPHLHFQVKKDDVYKDPYTFNVFPGIGYGSQLSMD